MAMNGASISARPASVTTSAARQLLARARLHGCGDLIFDRIQIEACGLLHWREFDERLSRLRHDLLDKNEAPELVGDPVVVRLRLVRVIRALHRIEAQICEDREVGFNGAAKPATGLVDEAILVITNTDRPERALSEVDDLISLRRSFPG